MTDRMDMVAITDGLPTKSAKIRALDAEGYARADIARFLDIRYQHVRNVLVDGPPKNPRAAVAVGRDAARTEDRIEVKIGPGGRIVIPAAFRETMEVGEGDTLVATIDGDGVVRLTSAATALRMARRIVREAIPADVSLSDSLIADRRREAVRETGEGID